MGFLSSLFGGGKSKTTAPVAVSGLQIQSSTQGLPIPLIFGATKGAGNLIWYGDFIATAQQSNAGSGGKGGVGGGGGGKGGGGGSTSYIYSTALATGLCAGPITGIGNVYSNKEVTTLAALGLTLFTGSYAQAPWGYLTTNHPTQADNYHGLAYVAAPSLQLGNSPQLPNVNYEIQGLLYGTAPNGIDADPSQVVTYLLSNSNDGAGFPSASIGSLTTYQAYTLANGLWISPSYNMQGSTQTILEELATATNSAWVWSSGLLTLVPYGDQAITANGYIYTPPSQPEYDLTDDDFLKPNNSTVNNSDDPVQITRSRNADAINNIKLEALDRSNQYNPAVVEWKNQALIDLFGIKTNGIKQTHLFCDLSAGNLSASLQGQRQSVRNTYTFSLDRRYILLDPMDIVTLTDSKMGLNRQWVRIIEITENDDRTLDFIAEEYLAGNGSAPAYSFQDTNGYNANYNQSPGNAHAPVIFEPPIQIAQTGNLEVDIAVSGSATFGGCDVWISSDNSQFAYAGRVTGAARCGVLSAILPIGTDPDTVNTLSVNLTQSFGALLSGTLADANANHTLCYVDGEYISYETATLTSTYNYDLNYLRRGQYGSTIASHSNGSSFARMDKGIFAYQYDKSKIGNTIYIKLLSFNLFGGGEQALSDVTSIPYTIVGPPLPTQVQNFQVTQNGNSVVFSWTDLVTDDGLKGYDIRYGAVGSSWDIKLELTEAHRGTEMTNADVPPGLWEFAIRAHDVADNLGPESLFSITVTNPNNLVVDQVQEPGWPGFVHNCVVHPSGVLIPMGTKNCDQYPVISTPSAPSVTDLTSGALGATTYYVKITYVDDTGETLASSETSHITLANKVIKVTSPGAVTGASGWNVYVSNTGGGGSGAETKQNSSPVAIGVDWTEPNSGLISGASPPVTNTTGWVVFDEYVPDPVSSCYYTAQTVDVSYDQNLRIYNTAASSLGYNQSGSVAALQFQIDTWLTGGSDPNSYTNWNIAYQLFRYLNGRLLYSGITQGNVSYITDFSVLADVAPAFQQSGQLAVAPGGQTLTFPVAFHTPPYVVPTAVSNTGLYASVVSITPTDCIIHIWNSSGTDVGGIANWLATGT